MPALAALLDGVRDRAPAARVVLLSSAAVYGAARIVPTPETEPAAPSSPYGEHKRACEELCRASGLATIALRLFSVYGPGLRRQLLWDACCKAREGALEFAGTGDEERDWLHVDDAVALVLVAAEHASPAMPIVNGGTGIGTRVRDVVTVIARESVHRRRDSQARREPAILRGTSPTSRARASSAGRRACRSSAASSTTSPGFARDPRRISPDRRRGVAGRAHVLVEPAPRDHRARERSRAPVLLVRGGEDPGDLRMPGVEVVTTGARFARAGRLIKLAARFDPVEAHWLHRARIDVLSHAPPVGFTTPTISWIPDVQHRHLPELSSRRERFARDLLFREALRDAAITLASSETARRDLEQFYRPTPRACASCRSSASRAPPRRFRSPSCKQKFDIPARFVHLPNQLWKHKNHGLVVEALRAAPDVVVVATGPTEDYRHAGVYDQLMARVGESGSRRGFATSGSCRSPS